MSKLEVGRAWRYSRYNDRNTACTLLMGKIQHPQTLWSFSSPDGRAAAAVSADADLDGKNEVVVVGLDNIHVLTGTNGRLLWSKSLTCHGSFAKIIPAAAVFDINRDGSPEILVAAETVGATAISGTERTLVWQHPTSGVSALGFGALDCDRTDVLQTDLRETVRIYRLRGHDGVRVWETSLPGEAHDLPVVADVNGDDSPEVVFHTRSGNGTPQETCCCLDAEGNVLWTRPLESAYNASAAPVVAADILGNGVNQILCLTDTTLTLLSGSGEIVWSVPTSAPQNAQLQGAAVGDINGDGKIEIVIGLGTVNSLAAFSGDTGSLLWRFDSNENCPENAGMSAPIIADINGDGHTETAVCSADGYLYTIKGSDGSLLWQHPAGSTEFGQVIFADINHDGFGELVVTCKDKVTAMGPV